MSKERYSGEVLDYDDNVNVLKVRYLVFVRDRPQMPNPAKGWRHVCLETEIGGLFKSPEAAQAYASRLAGHGMYDSVATVAVSFGGSRTCLPTDRCCLVSVVVTDVWVRSRLNDADRREVLTGGQAEMVAAALDVARMYSVREAYSNG